MKVWTSTSKIWRRMGWVVVGLACVAYCCVAIHWFQKPELTQMELFLETWQIQACGLGLAILGSVIIVLKGKGMVR